MLIPSRPMWMTRSQDEASVASLRRLSSAHGLSRVFNPSICVAHSRTYVALRAESVVGERPFRAYLAVLDRSGFGHLLDLTERLAGLGLGRIADPKLVLLGTDVFLTFNTGFTRGEPNQIFIMRVTEDVDDPREVLYYNRSEIEKNWAFHLVEDRLQCIYSLAPLVVLEAESFDGRADGPITLTRRAIRGGAVDADTRSLTIGSQLLVDSTTTGYLIAHDKIRIARKRAYIGRVARINGLVGGNPTVLLGRRRLLHGPTSLLPSHHPVNPNLWSATYFSGLSGTPDDPLLSYGINDEDFGISRPGPLQKLL